jgi:hypothetical protein
VAIEEVRRLVFLRRHEGGFKEPAGGRVVKSRFSFFFLDGVDALHAETEVTG